MGGVYTYTQPIITSDQIKRIYYAPSHLDRNRIVDFAVIILNVDVQLPSDSKFGPFQMEYRPFVANLADELYTFGHPTGLPMKCSRGP